MLERFNLAGRVALVTGAGQGIGEAIALALAEAGADVVVAARTLGPLEDTAARVRDHGRDALAVTCDVRDATAVHAMVEEAIDRFGHLDVLVTNAGAGGAPGHRFIEQTDAQLEDAFEFNVTARFRLARCCVPYMLGRPDPSITHITSLLGRVRDRGYVVSGTTNAAVAHMTRNMAADLAPAIRVNAIACGSVATPTLTAFVEDESKRAALAAATLMGRIGEPMDIAAAALFLASPAGGWVTGKVFEIDGGQEQASISFEIPDL